MEDMIKYDFKIITTIIWKMNDETKNIRKKLGEQEIWTLVQCLLISIPFPERHI